MKVRVMYKCVLIVEINFVLYFFFQGLLSDYTPMDPPYIPGIIVSGYIVCE
jgi:hypothetical protein